MPKIVHNNKHILHFSVRKPNIYHGSISHWWIDVFYRMVYHSSERRYIFNLVWELPSNIFWEQYIHKTDDVSRNPIGASKDLTESLRVLMIVSPWSLLIRDDALTLLGVQVESVEALVNCATQCQIARFQFLVCDFTWSPALRMAATSQGIIATSL